MSDQSHHTHMYGDPKHFLTKCMKLLKLLPLKEKVIGRTKAGTTTVIPMTDYFDTAYYISMNVGSWSVPYVPK